LVLSDRAIALTRRPVKDKGALMQTLHLRFRALRAISLGPRPDRWSSPSIRTVSTWKGVPPLPNHPSPTLAVGSLPARSHQRLARCPRQTASDLPPYPAPHEAGDLGTDHWQARALASRWLASSGLSFPLRPRRFRARSYEEKTADPVPNVRASARISSGAWARLHHRRGEGAWPATTSP